MSCDHQFCVRLSSLQPRLHLPFYTLSLCSLPLECHRGCLCVFSVKVSLFLRFGFLARSCFRGSCASFAGSILRVLLCNLFSLHCTNSCLCNLLLCVLPIPTLLLQQHLSLLNLLSAPHSLVLGCLGVNHCSFGRSSGSLPRLNLQLSCSTFDRCLLLAA